MRIRIKHGAGYKQVGWAVDLARMLQVGMVSYCVAGTFLSLTYFDLPWHFIAIVVLLKDYVQKHITQHKPLERSTRLVKTLVKYMS